METRAGYVLVGAFVLALFLGGLAMAVWFAASGGLRAYLALAGQDDQVYQRLGTPIAVVLWLYVSAVALLLGAELNAEIEKKWPTRETLRRSPAPAREE